jgi:nucleoside-diphosphate-sugar epimerase
MDIEAHFAASQFIRGALRGGPVVLRGTGNAKGSYLYAADLVFNLWRLLFSKNGFEVKHFTSPEEVSITSLAQRVAACSNTRVTHVMKANEKHQEDYVSLKRDIEFVTPLNEAIDKTLRWFKTNH